MKFALTLALFSLLVPNALAQQNTDTANTTFRTGTTLVLIPALVRTEKGEIVYTLTADDFLVTDDGAPQKLKLEEDTDSQPIALVIVVETGGAGAARLGSYGKLNSMLDSFVGSVPHQVAVVSFDSDANLVQQFTPDLDRIAGAMNSLQAGDDGAAIFDGLNSAVNLLRKQPPSYRRAILLISETLDRGSRIKLEEALRAISDTNTAIYSLGFSTTRSEMKHQAHEFNARDEPGPAGGCMSRAPKLDPDADADPDADSPKDADASPAKGKQPGRAAQAYDCASLLAPPLRAAKMLAMAALNGLHKNAPESVAQLTGGEYFKFENQKSFERSLTTIANHIPNRYVLSFQPQSPHGGLHEIKLTLNPANFAKLKVTARRSYWVEAEPR